MISHPIDAVITWVDGNDERHKAKRMKYGNETIFNAEDIAGSSRFASLGEIFYCVASLNRYAPWINKIYLVTDEQNPEIDSLIEKHFPDGHIPMERRISAYIQLNIHRVDDMAYSRTERTLY